MVSPASLLLVNAGDIFHTKNLHLGLPMKRFIKWKVILKTPKLPAGSEPENPRPQGRDAIANTNIQNFLLAFKQEAASLVIKNIGEAHKYRRDLLVTWLGEVKILYQINKFRVSFPTQALSNFDTLPPPPLSTRGTSSPMPKREVLP